MTLGVPASLNDILEVKLTEAMTLPLPEAAAARALGERRGSPSWNSLAEKTKNPPWPWAGSGPTRRPGAGGPAGARSCLSYGH